MKYIIYIYMFVGRYLKYTKTPKKPDKMSTNKKYVLIIYCNSNQKK